MLFTPHMGNCACVRVRGLASVRACQVSRRLGIGLLRLCRLESIIIIY